jgi:hypothetical protein
LNKRAVDEHAGFPVEVDPTFEEGVSPFLFREYTKGVPYLYRRQMFEYKNATTRYKQRG